MAYSSSTHARQWQFSQSTLAARYAQRCGVSRGAAVGEDRAEAGAARAGGGGGASKRPRPLDADGDASSKRPRSEAEVVNGPATAFLSEPVTESAVEDEQAYLDWCSLALLRMCHLAQFDRAITATALLYLRRFFIDTPFTHYPPHEML